MTTLTYEAALTRAGAGRFQLGLIGVFGLVWAADAMQVLAVGFTAAPIARSFGLTVPDALVSGTLFFLGMMLGAVLFGRLADRYGRRRVLIAAVSIDALFGLASVFAPNFALLCALRFVAGAAVGGTLPVDYAMMAEFLPPASRGRWLVLLEGFWAVGTVAVALVAWAASIYAPDEAWRWVFLATAVPAAVGVWLRLAIPESPLYLLRRDRAPEAAAIVDRILITNGKAGLAEGTRLVHATPAADGRLLAPALRRSTLGTLAVWFLVSLAYYGVFTWMPARLAGEGFGFVRGYGFLVLVALAQLPGYALAAWGVEAIGRKPTLLGFLLASAAGCLLFVLARNDAVVAASILLMSFALLGSWGALYAYTPELFPTALRGSGMGAAGAAARFGGLLAPSVVGFVVAEGFTLAVGFFAALLALAAVVGLVLGEETRRRPLG